MSHGKSKKKISRFSKRLVGFGVGIAVLVSIPVIYYLVRPVAGIPTPPPPPPPGTISLDVGVVDQNGVALTGSGLSATVDAGTPSQQILPLPFTVVVSSGPHTLDVAPQLQSGNTLYTFLSWEDNTTSPQRTINASASLTVAAKYKVEQLVLVTLKAERQTLSGYTALAVDFDLDGSIVPGGSTIYLVAGSLHTVTAPLEVILLRAICTFLAWSDGVSFNQRTFTAIADAVFTAQYACVSTPII